MSNLREIPASELQAELNRRAAEAEAERQRETEAHRALVEKHIDVLLEFRPKHGRTSCSDENPSNPQRCYRCDLLEIKRSGYWSNLVVGLDLHYGE